MAKLLGVTTSTITNWEKNRGGSALRLIPNITTFLGYDPVPETATTLGQKIKLYRRSRGLSMKKLAKKLGIDPTTLTRWERGRSVPSSRLRDRLNDLFDVLK
ncbi:MAG: helix-turn-helix transcriptional regulator [Ignavibacteriae bacterium]|nr:helix-turn-helix transcriptional regulator [Ignavibacteria bacterium]MBI3365079.1 helix-turn-helix transcriptional regulator [Ignavibacteriota bacterium]